MARGAVAQGPRVRLETRFIPVLAEVAAPDTFRALGEMVELAETPVVEVVAEAVPNTTLPVARVATAALAVAVK